MSANLCRIFWGSHGCDMDAGHDGDHTCDTRHPEGVCSQMRPVGRERVMGGALVRHYYDETDEWGEWSPSLWFR